MYAFRSLLALGGEVKSRFDVETLQMVYCLLAVLESFTAHKLFVKSWFYSPTDRKTDLECQVGRAFEELYHTRTLDCVEQQQSVLELRLALGGERNFKIIEIYHDMCG